MTKVSARQRCWNEIYCMLEMQQLIYQQIKEGQRPFGWGRTSSSVTVYNSDGGNGYGGESTTYNISNEAYRQKCKELGITPGAPIPEDKRNDEFLRLFQQTFFPDAPMEWVRKFTCEDIPDNVDFYEDDKEIGGVTRPRGYHEWEDLYYSGYSDVFLNQDVVFCSPEELYYDMGHELVHVSQNSELVGVLHDPKNTCIIEAKEFWAYSWQVANGGRIIGYNLPPNDCLSCYPEFNYINFNWTQNLIHP